LKFQLANRCQVPIPPPPQHGLRSN